MIKESVAIPANDGISLAAEQYGPEEETARGTLVFVHGFAGDRHENGLFDTLAAHLAEKGIRSITYDWRGLGGSQGDFASSDLGQHVLDFEAVLEWAQQHNQDPAGRLQAIGFSLGAAVVGLALHRGAPINRAAYLAPAVRPNISMWGRYNTPEIWQAIDQHGTVQKPGSDVLLGRQILESLRDTDLGEQAFAVDIPLLVCHGTADSRIDITHNRDLARHVTPGPGFRYVEFDGASHSFKPAEQHWQRLADELAEWFE